MASYLRSTQDFLYRRRRPFLIVGGLVGGVYMAASYVVSKLSDMQRRMVEERRDRENLRRRFAQNQEDCSYTVLALLPTLGDQLFAFMDVEELTAKLQRGRQAPANGTHTPVAAAVESREVDGAKRSPEQMSASIVELNGSHSDAVSEQEQTNGHAINASTNADGKQSSDMEEVWNRLKDDSQQQTQDAQPNGAPEASMSSTDGVIASEVVKQPSASGLDAVAEPPPQPIPALARLSPSPQPSPNVSLHEVPSDAVVQTTIANGSHPAQSTSNAAKADEDSASASAVIPATAAELAEEALREKQAKLLLWNELKITSISRTITSLYGLVLLSLQTHVQLNLLGRYAYLTSVSSLSTQAESTTKHHIRIERHDGQGPFEDDYEDEDDREYDHDDVTSSPLKEGVDVQTERLYLTLSWWFLHRGWQQLANVVQDAVHDVFDDIALKMPLTHAEFAALVRKVRRRVEYESPWNGGGASVASLDARSEWSETTNAPTAVREARRGRRRNFSGILFPPAQQEVQTLLDAGALSSSSRSLDDVSPTLAALLDETRDIIESDDFWRVMRLNLARVFEVFEDALRPAFGLGPAKAAAASTVASAERPPASALPAIPDAGNEDAEEIGKAVRLASLFPTVARQSTAAIHGTPNEYVDALATVKEMRAFCAVIYSAWS